jgi:GGDEF domain-containing protein
MHDRPGRLTSSLVALLALAIGAGVASELLAPPARRRPAFEMLDRDSLAYSEPFFMLRLRQEMSRARRSRTTIVAALINVGRGSVFETATPRSRRDALRRLGGLLDSHVRSEDIVARIDSHVFAVLLPDTTEAEALPMIEAVRHRIALPVVGEHGGLGESRSRPRSYSTGPGTRSTTPRRSRWERPRPSRRCGRM